MDGLRYVERNPLRANLVEARCVAMVESLASRPRHKAGYWTTSVALPATLRQHVQTPQTEAELEAFGGVVVRGSPFARRRGRSERRKRLGSNPRCVRASTVPNNAHKDPNRYRYAPRYSAVTPLLTASRFDSPVLFLGVCVVLVLDFQVNVSATDNQRRHEDGRHVRKAIPLYRRRKVANSLLRRI